jgi:hypothetical protein
VIYYVAAGEGYIYLLAIYGKNDQAELDRRQVKRLAAQVKEWLQ